jgi:hypothetical protein
VPCAINLVCGGQGPKGGGQSLETLSPADARAVLVGVQAGAKLPQSDVSERTITVDGKSIKLTPRAPARRQGRAARVHVLPRGRLEPIALGRSRSSFGSALIDPIPTSTLEFALP